MFATYARVESGCPMVRVGHRVKTMDKALDRARKLKAAEALEVRDESKPRSRSLVAMFVKGTQIG